MDAGPLGHSPEWYNDDENFKDAISEVLSTKAVLCDGRDGRTGVVQESPARYKI